MKKIFIGIAALAALFATQAFAADMPVKAPPKPPTPVTSWTGFYLGINGGGGWGTTDHTDEFGVTTNKFRTSGGLVGGTYGANWQTGWFVLGFEGDFDYANINGNFNNAVLYSGQWRLHVLHRSEELWNGSESGSACLREWMAAVRNSRHIYGQVGGGQSPCAYEFGGFSCQ